MVGGSEMDEATSGGRAVMLPRHPEDGCSSCRFMAVGHAAEFARRVTNMERGGSGQKVEGEGGESEGQAGVTGAKAHLIMY